MPNPSLPKLIKKWKSRLGLSHWTIEVAYYETLEMDDPGDFGSVEYNLLRRWAKIKILKPSAAVGKVISPINVEQTVIHELVHLVLAPVARKCEDLRALEHAVDDLTNALYKTDELP